MSDQKRSYRMQRRAELEEQTRTRITESAVALHEELGPARTSISAIAELAGVRRSTVYRHFPDEEALFAACSSHWRSANPPPDPHDWAAIEEPAARTEAALRELYAFYGRTQAMYTSLLRDEPLVPAVQHRLRDFYGYLHAIEDILHGRTGPAGEGGAPDARRGRPRPGLPDVALADAGAGTVRRRCRHADVPARGRSGYSTSISPYSGGPVSSSDCIVAPLGVDVTSAQPEPRRRPLLGEEPLARSQHDREDDEPDGVDQARVEERPRLVGSPTRCRRLIPARLARSLRRRRARQASRRPGCGLFG